MVALAAVWGLWITSRSKVFDQARAHFARMVDALEEGDVERAEVCKKVFNEISGNALSRLSLEQLVRRMYVDEQDVLRIHALNEPQGR